MHVRDLDALEDPLGRAERERRAGIVGVHVHLQRGRVADDHQRVPELLQLVLEPVEVEPLALDDKNGAVAVLARAPGGLRRSPTCSRSAGSAGSGLAGQPGGHTAHELEQPRASRRRRRPPGGGSRGTPACARAHPRPGARPPAAGRRPEIRLRVHLGLRLFRELADHRQHRPLLRLAHRTVRSVARGAERARERPRVDRLVRRRSPRQSHGRSARGSRRSCPGRPSARRARSAARARSRSDSSSLSSASLTARTVSVRFVPVSPSGTG